ncbi:hypothetical protein CAPN002_06170 [Capnocytophaga stomatis]|uniref:hypothetical protein n=1 Tax=Capnocytophaga stomatis TaxID=1848904 RepID=UPI00194F2928|nr:hypothetical protein [Capnocytophaga stomatis]GIJ93399.1 hypothetical protein CAPN002_06170 [Capnocytophaga stomatis]
MLPVYTFVVDIDATKHISEKQFREQVASSLAYLDALKGSLDQRLPCTHTFYPPYENETHASEFWSVRSVASFSLGKKRAECLAELCKGIAQLIRFLLPEADFDVNIQMHTMKFEG